MIDHIMILVSDPVKSFSLYESALKTIGNSKQIQIPLEESGGRLVYGFGPHPKLIQFWIAEGKPHQSPVHVAFVAETRQQVDQFYETALKNGGRDNGAPGLRPQYLPNYYAAFFLDFDGNNIEVVCRKAE
eukprot:TRINITY_DN8709_c0_g1_i1.p1 TRINITY_DN8709_c0_g1~~TRINITY_DN8709_c0_g1_i1.p1  ORF type:complete len:130 (+),score=30.81 TRINITY_DN8709_c0_g1_i1:97-486(+)